MKKVKCKWCGENTSMTATEECDFCWELRSRMEKNPELSQSILDSLKIDHHFKRKLEIHGKAEAPNGATYEMTVYGNPHRPAVNRIHHGRKEIIVGVGGRSFDSPGEARSWAAADGTNLLKPTTFNGG